EFAGACIEASRPGCRGRTFGCPGRRGRPRRTGSSGRAGPRRPGSARHRRKLRLRRAGDRPRHAAGHRLGAYSSPARPPDRPAGGGHDRLPAAWRGPDPLRRQTRPAGAAAQAVRHRPALRRARPRGARTRRARARL
ncbi:MAG: hypothetical protein AVDCRST_MAG08-336, partial [uncultured Acetobacteraceae bacterium]